MSTIERSQALLTERIGILGVTALVVGNAISIPIFVLPGPLAGSTGPSVVLAAVVAAIPAALLVLYNAQLGSAMPVAGGLYVYISRLTAPYWGFLVPFTLLIVTWANLVFTAIGFANYSQFFVDVPSAILIYIFLVGVLLVNLLGIKTVARAQILFVVLLVASLVTFIVPGLFAVDVGNYSPTFTGGFGGFGLASVALFFPYLGFGLVTELGEEVENPGRTIPLVLISGIAIVAVFYVALLVVLLGVMPAGELAATDAAVAHAATRFLPGPLAGFVALGALFAVASTVNTTLLVASRTVMRAARDGIFPERLARVHPRFETPYYSSLLLGLPPLAIAAFIQEEVVALSVFIALAVLTAMFFSAISLWNLPREFPDHYANATLRLRRYRGLLFAVVSGLVTSATLWFISLARLPLAGLLLFSWFLLGYGYYRYKIATDEAGGDLYVRMVTLADHESAFAERQTYEGIGEEPSNESGGGSD